MATRKVATKSPRSLGPKTARPPRPAGSKKGRPLSALELALAALPAEAARTPPAVPVTTLLQEAANVVVAARKHRARLSALPFRHALVDELPARIEALREAEAEWRAVRARRTPEAFKRDRAEAEALKRDLLAAGRYLLRHDGDAQAELSLIVEGDGLADLVSDLDALARFADARRKALRAADLPGGLAGAIKRSRQLARGLSEAASDEASDASAGEALGRRNRCCALVAEALDEIRAAARYAFRHEPRSLAPYRQTYQAAKQARSRGPAVGEPAPPLPADPPVTLPAARPRLRAAPRPSPVAQRRLLPAPLPSLAAMFPLLAALPQSPA